MPEFDDLNGINREKEIKRVKTNNLDSLIASRDYLITHYQGHGLPHLYEFMKEHIGQEMKKKAFSSLVYDESDLKDFVYSSSGQNLSPEASFILGLYSGFLLELLTEKNRKQGKRTVLHLDGNNQRFDYLFYKCRFADELVIENFVGDDICGSFAEDYGRVESLIIKNCRGDSMLSTSGYPYGKIGVLGFIQNEGKYNLSMAGKEAQIGVFYAYGNKGLSFAENLSAQNGEVGLAVFDSNEMRGYLKPGWAHVPGRFDLLLFSNTNQIIQSNTELDLLINSSFFVFIRLMAVKNCRYSEALKDFSKISTIVYENQSETDKEFVSELKIDELYSLADSIPKADAITTIDILKKMKSLRENNKLDNIL